MSKLFGLLYWVHQAREGTISERIAQSFGLKHLSSGDFLRENIAANAEAGVLAKTYIKKGLLLPDHVMNRLLLPRLEEITTYSWVLDGFPRTLAQAEALNSACDLDVVINLNIPLETLKDRLRHRWIHPSSGRVYNMHFNPPRVQGLDDITGETLIQQEDDRPEALVARLRHYKDIAKPVIDLYKVKGILYTFSDTETDRIWPNINTLLSTKIPTLQSDARCASTHSEIL